MYLYPQALAKQLVMKAPSGGSWNPTDIIAAFNSDNDPEEKLPNGVSAFWFKESKVPIIKNQYDLELTILHELLHGLGFTSKWNRYIPSVKYPGNFMNFLTPQFNFDKQSDGIKMNGCEPLSIYDKFIYIKSENKPLSDYYSRMTSDSLCKENQKPADWFKIFNSTVGKDSRILFGYATTPNSLELRIGSRKVDLYTANHFSSGSAISHVSSSYKASSESLMIAQQRVMFTNADAINWYKSPIDKMYLDLFEKFGYVIKRK